MLKKLSKHHIVTILIVFLAVCIFFSTYFVITGVKAKASEGELIDKINDLTSVCNTLTKNNETLKASLIKEQEKNRGLDSENPLIVDSSDTEPIETYTYIREMAEFPSFLDKESKSIFVEHNLNQKLLSLAFEYKVKSGDYPDVFTEIPIINNFYLIDQSHCFVQLEGTSGFWNYIYEIDYQTDLILFTKVSEVSPKSLSRKATDYYNYGNTFLVDAWYDMNTFELVENVIKHKATTSIFQSPDNRFSLKVTNNVDPNEDNQVVMELSDVNNNKVEVFSPSIEANTFFNRYWSYDSRYVLIGAKQIYDVTSKALIDLAYPMTDDDRQSYLDIMKDYILVTQLVIVKEDKVKRLQVLVFDFKGKLVNTIVLNEIEVDDLLFGNTNFYTRVASDTKNQIDVMYFMDNHQINYFVDIDKNTFREGNEYTMTIPELNLRVLSQNVQTESEKKGSYSFMDLSDQLVFTLNTEGVILTNYVGFDKNKKILYFYGHGLRKIPLSDVIKDEPNDGWYEAVVLVEYDMNSKAYQIIDIPTIEINSSEYFSYASEIKDGKMHIITYYSVEEFSK